MWLEGLVAQRAEPEAIYSGALVDRRRQDAGWIRTANEAKCLSDDSARVGGGAH
jgi:hypothetical protein